VIAPGTDQDAGSEPGVVIVTNGNAFARCFLDETLRRHADRITHVHIVTGIRADTGRVRAIARYARRSGLRYVAYKASTYVAPLVLAATRQVHAPFVWQVTEELGVPTSFVTDPNAGAVLDQLRSRPGQLLVSVSCPMRIDAEVLEAATLGAINVHSSALPTDAGLAPYVWVLARDAPTTAVTVHVMDPRIDTGEVLQAPQVDIEPRTSAMALFLRQAEVGGRALSEVVGRTLHDGRLPAGTPQAAEARTYHGMPTRESIAALRANGHRLVRRGDLRRLVGRLRAGTRLTVPVSLTSS
jgi:folate-dependent phosphoribosylglycinamide formyltransferase PurN